MYLYENSINWDSCDIASKSFNISLIKSQMIIIEKTSPNGDKFALPKLPLSRKRGTERLSSPTSHCHEIEGETGKLKGVNS